MKEITEYDFPQELKDMDVNGLNLLAYQIRDFLLENVSRTGGHLASNLGVVELTIALHKVLDSPRDKIVWDVGHQSYVHKILTGRAGEFSGLRKYDGISGFPKRNESVHDVYDAGHSSDSISIALGIAKARELKKEDFAIVAVIGDGALTGGIAYEALNNAAIAKNRMIIIVNDNQMSISRNIGGLTQHLGRLRLSPSYTALKKRIQSNLSEKGAFGQKVYRSLEKARDAVKYVIMNQCMFENLGFKYYGPIDGHNIQELIEFLSAAKEMNEPVILHVVTKKGKGFGKIENNPDVFHGIGPFSLDTMEPLKASGSSYSKVFGDKLVEMAKVDERIVAISAAMTDGTGLQKMQKAFPSRVFDVGIAEQHAVSFAAGLALQGMRPVVAIYSTFLQRAYDEILTDVCLQNLPVVFCIDRAGNVGADGETHNGQFDLSYLSHMPNMTIMAPGNGTELAAMMEYALELGSPCAIRYPRGEAACVESVDIADGKCRILKKGKKTTIIAVGKFVDNAVKAADILEKRGISCGVINGGFVKPLDEAGIRQAVNGLKLVVTLEDNVVSGGFGAGIDSLLSGDRNSPRIINLGWPDQFIRQGNTSELEKIFGLDPESVADRIIKEL